MKRSLDLTPELLRLYSRRGNFHSDPDAAGALGYQRLVAQGMQVAGPAYGLLMDAWGEEFLAHGTFELKFISPATDGETVEAEVDVTADAATIEVTNRSTAKTVVIGHAYRTNESE